MISHLPFSVKALRHGFLGLALTAASSSLALAQSNAAKADLDHVRAVYAVTYNNSLTATDAKLNIDNQQNRYSVDFSANHALLDTEQKAQFTINNCQVTPLSYESNNKPALSRSSRENIRFDWQQNVATRDHNRDGQAQYSLSSTRYDPMSLFFKARCELIAGKKSLSLPVLYKGKERTHRYEVVGQERVATPYGEYDALVVQRQRSNPDRRTVFYVAPALDYLLVKMEHRESSLATVTLNLKSLDYQAR